MISHRRRLLKSPREISLYSDSFNGAVNTGNYTSNGTFNATPRDGSGDLIVTCGTVGTFLAWLTYNPLINALENFTRVVPFKVTTYGGTAGFGIGCMIFQSGVNSAGLICNLNLADGTNANRGKIQWIIGATIIIRSSTSIPVAINDECCLTLERTDAITFKATYINFTQALTITDTFNGFDFAYPQTNIKPGTFKHAIWAFGGTQLLHSDDITTTNKNNCNILFVGDSITFGNFGGSIDARFTNIIGNTTKKSYYVEAGPGDRAADLALRIELLKSYKAKFAVLAVGTNDASAAIATTPFKNSLLTIVNGLQDVGTKVILCKILPRGDAVSITAYNGKIDEFTSNKVVDTYTAFLSAGVQNTALFTADLIHPNSTGHTTFANTVISQAPECL